MPVASEPAGVVAVVLAAGLSRRMGASNKLLLPVAGQAMVRHVVQAALASLKAEGLAILLVEQNTRFALALADQVTLISRGGAVWTGNPGDFAQAQAARARYLGA